MDLSTAEKLILANQYQILKQLDPEREGECDLLLKCLYEGYLYDFEQLMPHFDKRIDPAVRAEVRDILDMFRALNPGGRQAHAKFAGFDGNDETEHYAYARFLIEDRGLWRESKNEADDYNTHAPVVDDYRAMLKVLREAKDPNNLSSEEILEIVDVSPFGSRPPETTSK